MIWSGSKAEKFAFQVRLILLNPAWPEAAGDLAGGGGGGGMCHWDGFLKINSSLYGCFFLEGVI